MRKSITSILTVLVATALLLTGCDPILPSGGKSVKFTATSRSQVTTKTAYSGNIDAETKREAIYWDGNDKIRIYSSNTEVVATPNGTDYAEYSLEVSATPTHAKLVNDAANGLAWKQSGEVTFYAVYPPSTPGSTVGIFDMGIPTTQEYRVPTETVMDHAYMLAKNKLSGMNDVSLNFYPAFTAFQINLKSLDDELTLEEFRIFYLDPTDPENENDIRLSGPYWGGIDADNNMSFLRYPYNDEFSSSFVDPDYDDFSQVRVAFTEGTKVTSGTDGTAVNFTLFTLPFMGGINASVNENYLTNLWLEVTYKKNDNDGNPTGTPITKRLALTQEKEITTSDGSVTTTEFYQFEACKKYRLNGLAVGDKWKFKISLDPDELQWDKIEESTTFSQNIQATPFDITNATETGNHYYPEGTKDYQVRTLNMDYDHFVVTFKPMAPLGGYWQLIPYSNGGMGTAAFKVEVWDTDMNEGNPDLKGQIMNQSVMLHVTSLVTDDQRTEDHAIIIKALFSTSPTFDENSTYSADSEIQDAHKDGSFSYWRFVIPAKVN